MESLEEIQGFFIFMLCPHLISLIWNAMRDDVNTEKHPFIVVFKRRLVSMVKLAYP